MSTRPFSLEVEAANQHHSGYIVRASQGASDTLLDGMLQPLPHMVDAGTVGSGVASLISVKTRLSVLVRSRSGAVEPEYYIVNTAVSCGSAVKGTGPEVITSRSFTLSCYLHSSSAYVLLPCPFRARPASVCRRAARSKPTSAKAIKGLQSWLATTLTK